VKAATLAMGGILMVVAAFLYFVYAFRMAVFPPYDSFFYGEAAVSSSERLLVGIPGILAFASGLTVGITSLIRKHFWLAVLCGGISLVAGFWTLLANNLLLPGFAHLSRNLPILGYLLILSFTLAVVGLILVATSREDFS
jgi:hypothetical protein